MLTPDLTWSLPDSLAARVRARLDQMRRADVVSRIWSRDSTVWSSGDEDRWLGWLDLPKEEAKAIAPATRLAREVKDEGTTDVVLLGMGGSSLAPEVMRLIIGPADGYPNLHVLDSTDPGQILAVEKAIHLPRTVFLVASKSGTTLEVNILKQHFFQRAVDAFGETEAGRRFVLTTDPKSKLEEVAAREGFRAVFAGIPSVGGRYSALSHFGLVPAAMIGADPVALVERAERMATRCASNGPDNTAFELGVLLGELALAGRDKPTLIAPPSLASFGTWLEQLVAESLGKQGKAVIPIDGEPLGDPDVYGHDRVFVYLRSHTDGETDARVAALQAAGHPVVHIPWTDPYALGAEFFRWEFATAVAGAVLGVNPFDQPDVEAAKVVTRRLAADFEKSGTVQGEKPTPPGEAADWLMGQLGEGDYFAMLAFIEMTDAHRQALDEIRRIVRDRRKVATTVGFGPRYLHSTGQAHKGGPASGVFLVITADPADDLPVPGQKYTFGTIELLQALGDYEVLKDRGRRVRRVHFEDPAAGLRALRAAVEKGGRV